MTATTTAPAVTTSGNSYVALVGHDNRTLHWMARNASWRPGKGCTGGMSVNPDGGWPAVCGATGLKVTDVTPKHGLNPCRLCAAQTRGGPRVE